MNRKLGDYAENIAAQFLYRQNYKILFRNLRLRPHEIDIISEKDGFFHLWEVRLSKYFPDFPTMERIVSPKKLKNLQIAREKLLSEKFIECSINILIVYNNQCFLFNNIDGE